MADEVAARLARMRRAMAKLLCEGRQREFDAVAAAYEALKRERDQEEAGRLRAARLVARPVTAERAPEEPKRWRLPRGFGVSPLAAHRAVHGSPSDVPVVPVGRPALSPWRRVSPMAEQVWRPGPR